MPDALGEDSGRYRLVNVASGRVIPPPQPVDPPPRIILPNLQVIDVNARVEPNSTVRGQFDLHVEAEIKNVGLAASPQC
jgi:hypothetical protein